MSGKMVLDSLANAQYAIFDDWKGGLPMFPAYKDWLGAQWDISVRKFHHDAEIINWGRPCIWLCNRDPRMITSTKEDPIDWAWMDANCIFVELWAPLFTSHANTE